jgi:[ribosomal protein S5]-alanine N-acetyltransferase
MEKMPYQPGLEVIPMPQPMTVTGHADITTTSWRAGLPVLCGKKATLRELRMSDAPSLLAMLATEEVARFISPPPTTVEGFEGFIAWTYAERMAGRHACFAVVPAGYDTAVGLFQVRQLEPGFATAEWGFAIGSPFWGTGIFKEGARMVVDFSFDTLGVHRLEARSCVRNVRGNGALRKIGAVQEGVLRRSFLHDGEYLDQALWSILRDDWYQAKAVWGSKGKVGAAHEGELRCSFPRNAEYVDPVLRSNAWYQAKAVWGSKLH